MPDPFPDGEGLYRVTTEDGHVYQLLLRDGIVYWDYTKISTLEEWPTSTMAQWCIGATYEKQTGRE